MEGGIHKKKKKKKKKNTSTVCPRSLELIYVGTYFNHGGLTSLTDSTTTITKIMKTAI